MNMVIFMPTFQEYVLTSDLPHDTFMRCLKDAEDVAPRPGSWTNMGRWSAGRRWPLRHWGRASRVAGPAGHARAARAGPFAKGYAREPRKLPWGLANPWRLPALHYSASAGEGKGDGRTRRPKTKNTGGRALAT